MQEAFVHFLWRFQYFDKRDLRTTAGQPVQVLGVGTPHADAGPDFRQARLRLGDTEWAGHVEIHGRSSQWRAHGHQHNAAYDSVVLHVVWEDDRPVIGSDGTPLPTLALRDRADPRLLARYQALLHNLAPVPCASQFARVPPLEKMAVLDRVLTQRLEHKAEAVLARWQANQRDWPETAYQWLTRHFGFKLNNEPFDRLARALPLKVLRKHRDQLPQLEALLFGQAGLLPDADGPPAEGALPGDEDYARTLRREHAFLRHKYALPAPVTPAEWYFLRLRPPNFPPVRLAQLAQLLHQQPDPFALLTQTETVAELARHLRVTQSGYWQRHYGFGKPAAAPVAGLGRAAFENLVVNAAVPLLVAYGRATDTPGYLDRALRWLEALPPERNRITDQWQQLGLPIRTAFDAQASLELYNHGCAQRKCLQCGVGAWLLKNAVAP